MNNKLLIIFLFIISILFFNITEAVSKGIKILL